MPVAVQSMLAVIIIPFGMHFWHCRNAYASIKGDYKPVCAVPEIRWLGAATTCYTPRADLCAKSSALKYLAVGW